MSTKETALNFQDQYLEKLGLEILYNPPKFFELFYKIVKPFVEPKTANKVKFVYVDDPNTKTIMEELFSRDELDFAFGGKNDMKIYAEKMKTMQKGLLCMEAEVVLTLTLTITPPTKKQLMQIQIQLEKLMRKW